MGLTWMSRRSAWHGTIIRPAPCSAIMKVLTAAGDDAHEGWFRAVGMATNLLDAPTWKPLDSTRVRKVVRRGSRYARRQCAKRDRITDTKRPPTRLGDGYW